jgi:hypothetical protein
MVRKITPAMMGGITTANIGSHKCRGAPISSNKLIGIPKNTTI